MNDQQRVGPTNDKENRLDNRVDRDPHCLGCSRHRGAPSARIGPGPDDLGLDAMGIDAGLQIERGQHGAIIRPGLGTGNSVRWGIMVDESV